MATKDELHPLDENLQTDDRLIALTIVLSVVFFAFVNEALRHLSRRYVTFRMTSGWRCRNLAVSWIHADIAAAACIYWYAVHSHAVHTWLDVLDLQNPAASFIIAGTAGYFVYDCWDHIREGKAVALWEVTAHHVAVILIFGYNLLFHFAIVSSILALMVEVNSVFLHGRKLLQLLGVPFSHRLYRFVVLLNLLSFLLFRGVPLALTCVAFVLNVHRCTPLYAVALGTVLLFMALLNPVLFWRLLRNDLLRGTLKKKEKKKEKEEEEEEWKEKEEKEEWRVKKVEEEEEVVVGKRAGARVFVQNGQVSRDEAEEVEVVAGKDSRKDFRSSPRNGFNVVHRSKAS